MKLSKRNIYIIVFLIFLALIFFTPTGTFLKEKINEWSNMDVPDRDFSFFTEETNIALKGYNGTPDANLNDFQGEVVFINFWGSWCPPCVAEMPSIQALYEAKGEKVKIVLITMNDKPGKFVPFLEDNHYTMPVYEAESLIPSAMMPKVFPTTYILDKKGNIVRKEMNTADWNTSQIHELLDRLTNE